MNIWTKKVVIAIFVVANYMQTWVKAKPEVPCYFIFGDSLVDDGNNNPLLSLAKVNYPPYGIDFPKGPTGRFTNGQTQADVLGKLMGFDKFIPPFVTARGHVILEGVNYASGGGGILDETSGHQGQRISMDEQLKNHEITVLRIKKMLRSKNSSITLLRKCLYYVGMGANDYLNNYFFPNYNTSQLYTPEQFATLLIQKYHNQIMRLYNNGARKVALIGIGQIGCTPFANSYLAKNAGSGCVDYINNAAQLFNQKIIGLVDQLNTNLTRAKFIYVNNYGFGARLDLESAGFTIFHESCCPSNNYGLCIPLLPPSPNRDSYVFWDFFHPTQAMNLLTANRSYTALRPSDTYPMDISHLVKLDL
ncbi:hypothetical protein UlMin_018768 [Ulmus minor]